MTYHAVPTMNSAARVGPCPVDHDYSMSGPQDTMGAAKNEKTRTADRANGRHMVRVRPPTSSEERKRLMLSISPTPDNSSTCTEPHVDGCPECVVNTEAPYLHEIISDLGKVVCQTVYRCADCGHDWSTSWGGR